MKNILLMIMIMFFSSSAMACESSHYAVYYLPLDMNLYVPPSRKDIIKNGIGFEINSCFIKDLFKKVDSQKGIASSQDDYTALRIMIVNKKNEDEIFITTEKVVLSLSKKKKYNIDIKLVDEVLKELIDFVDKNKFGRL